MKWYCSQNACLRKDYCARHQVNARPHVYSIIIEAETFDDRFGCDGFKQEELEK